MYACHPTTIGGTGPYGYLIGTDYPGYACDWVEAAYPGATAVFLPGCGGDIKPRYVPDAASYPEGGYEVGRSAFAPAPEDLLVETARRHIMQSQSQPIHKDPIPLIPALREQAGDQDVTSLHGTSGPAKPP